MLVVVMAVIETIATKNNTCPLRFVFPVPDHQEKRSRVQSSQKHKHSNFFALQKSAVVKTGENYQTILFAFRLYSFLALVSSTNRFTCSFVGYQRVLVLILFTSLSGTILTVKHYPNTLASEAPQDAKLLTASFLPFSFLSLITGTVLQLQRRIPPGRRAQAMATDSSQSRMLSCSFRQAVSGGGDGCFLIFYTYFQEMS